MSREEKLNNYRIKTIPKPEEDDDTRPMKGIELTGNSQPHHNMFLCAMKNSGKTTIIWNMLQACADKHTTIVAFVGTLHSDNNWLGIQRWCLEKNINFIGYNEFDEEVDVGELNDSTLRLRGKPKKPEKALEWWIKCLESESKDRQAAKESGDIPRDPRIRLMEDEEEEEEDNRPYQTPKYIFIADDLGDLKNKHWVKLIKRHRHYQAWTISSSQYFNDLAKAARKNVDLILVFGKINKEKMEQIYEDANVLIPFEQFYTLYRQVTDPQYQFLWINTTNGELRNGFNSRLVLPKIQMT